MSYRSVKRMLGETNLERKCRILFGGCLLTLIMGSFWWYSSETNKLVLESTRETARGLAKTILTGHHWVKLAEKSENESEKDFAVLYQALGTDLTDQDYDCVFINPNRESPDHPLDELEIAELNEFNRDPPPEKNWDEHRINGRYLYFQAIRTKETCIKCHTTHGLYQQAEVRPGDLEAVMKITLPDTETALALNKNISILLSFGIVTVFLAMIASWAIVRYVVVKPLKHLRNVSDEISRGNVSLRADIHTGDEFEDLGVAFNRMLSHLTTIQEELRNANTNLDVKVDELAQLNMQLYEMNRLKSEFLAMMSHELRTPLNAIIGFSDVLETIASLDEKQKRYVKNIQTSGKVLLEMINDILDLAKIESGNMDVRLSYFPIEGIIRGLCDAYMQATERKNIDLKAEIEPGLPEMFQDQVKVQQILSNLLSNAIKFTPEGGRITITAGRDDKDELVMKVIDTGVGIAEEDQTVIFQKFRQGKAVFSTDDAMTREYSGTGLGLSIVKELCKLLGGEISLESQVGQGSTFTIRLPWTRAEQPQMDSTLSAAIEGLAKGRRGEYPRATDQPVGVSN